MKVPWRSKTLWVVSVIVVALLVVRARAPIWVRDYVNRKINETPDYRGTIGDVDINLWRGAYRINNIDIRKKTGEVPVPFFSASLIDFSVQWKALWERSLVGEIYFHEPKINIVKGPTEETSQAGVDQPWTQKIKEMFPLNINRFEVRNGEIRYRDFHSKPQVNAVTDKLDILATNLTNSKKVAKTLNAHIEVYTRPMREGEVRMKIDLDPYAAAPTFDTAIELSGVSLVSLNQFAKAYGSVTFEEGTLRVASHLQSKNGTFSGYVEPVFDKMKILNLKRDATNPVQLVWESLVAGVTRIVRNPVKDRFATRIPLSGSFKDPKVAILPTIINVFRNAIIRVFEGKVEGENIDLGQMKKEQQDEK